MTHTDPNLSECHAPEPAPALPEGRPAPQRGAPLPPQGSIPLENRETWPAVWRGYRGRCPNCGSGPILRSYLKVRPHCPACREPFHHHRADDGPAYLTILIVGHILAPALLWVFTTWRPEPLILITIFSIGCIGLSLYLLPRLKGAIVAFQWARGMHGFGKSGDSDAPHH